MQNREEYKKEHGRYPDEHVAKATDVVSKFAMTKVRQCNEDSNPIHDADIYDGHKNIRNGMSIPPNESVIILHEYCTDSLEAEHVTHMLLEYSSINKINAPNLVQVDIVGNIKNATDMVRSIVSNLKDPLKLQSFTISTRIGTRIDISEEIKQDFRSFLQSKKMRKNITRSALYDAKQSQNSTLSPDAIANAKKLCQSQATQLIGVFLEHEDIRKISQLSCGGYNKIVNNSQMNDYITNPKPGFVETMKALKSLQERENQHYR